MTASGWVSDEGADLLANFGLNAISETQGGEPVLMGQLDFVEQTRTAM